MYLPVKVRGAVTAVRKRRSAVTYRSDRTRMLGTVLVVSAVSAATGYLLVQCASVDVLSSLLWIPEDCWLDWGMNIGRHCFSDYAAVVGIGTRPNPWETYPMFLPPEYQPMRNAYPAAGLIPHLLFGLPAKWLGAPRLGLVGYLLALTIAVLSPALWAARGARGLERIVVFVALGAAAIPAWAVIDRGNSAGFVVPIALVFLVALCRRRWGLVAMTVVLAAMVKPQFAVLVVALWVVRQWRWSGIAIVGVLISNSAAYLLWPKDFPKTITQSMHNLLHFSTSFTELTDVRNVSFGRALLLLPDMAKASQTGGKLPDGFLAGPRSFIGYAILLVVVVSLLALGRRIPPVMAGIVVLATATLFPSFAAYYYLVFVLPVAALVVRDPDGQPGTGMFDRLALHGGPRRAVGIWVTLAAALSIAQVAIPGQQAPVPIWGQFGARGVVGSTTIVLTTVPLMPILWLVACAVIIVSYARRSARSDDSDQALVPEGPSDTAVSTPTGASEPMAESSIQRPG